MSTQLPVAPGYARGGASAYGGLAATTLPQARYPEAALSGVLQYIGQARRAIARHDVPAAHTALVTAQQVLAMLRAALDFRAGGELAERLQAVYTFVSGELGQANLEKNAARLDALPAIIEPLREAFARAAAAHLAGHTAEAAGGSDRR